MSGTGHHIQDTATPSFRCRDPKSLANVRYRTLTLPLRPKRRSVRHWMWVPSIAPRIKCPLALGGCHGKVHQPTKY
jgi:hypothetical protein